MCRGKAASNYSSGDQRQGELTVFHGVCDKEHCIYEKLCVFFMGKRRLQHLIITLHRDLQENYSKTILVWFPCAAGVHHHSKLRKHLLPFPHYVFALRILVLVGAFESLPTGDCVCMLRAVTL